MKKSLRLLAQLDVTIATLLTLAILVVVMLQVISRLLPGNAIPWTVEMGEVLLAAVIWMGLGLGVLSNNHVRFDLFLSKMPFKARKVLYVCGNIVFAMFLLILAFYTIELLSFYIKSNTRTPSLRWNKAIIRVPVFLGCVIGALRMLIQAWFFATDRMPLPTIDNEINEAVASVEHGCEAREER